MEREIKEASIYKDRDDDLFYLRLVWIDTHDDGTVVEHRVPKARFPIEFVSLKWVAGMSGFKDFCELVMTMPMYEDGFELKLVDNPYEYNPKAPKVAHASKILNKEMTLEEIEKALGYPVKIVKVGETHD